MKIKTLIIGLLTIICITNVSADSTFGWIGKFSSNQLFDLDGEGYYSNTAMKLSPSLNINWENLEFNAEVELSYLIPDYSAEVDLKEFSISYITDSFWKINAGRYYYLPGTSEFFSNTNYFASTDYIELIENQGEDFYSAGDILQVIITGESIYLTSTFSVSPIEMSVIDLNSKWFPSSSIPKSLKTFGGDTYYQNDISMADPETIPIAWKTISIGFEGGWNTYMFDLSVQYYHGRGNEFLYQMDIDLRDDDLFDMEITPLLGDVQDCIGLNWLWNFNRMYMWVDGSFNFNRTFIDNTLRLPGLFTTTDQAHHLASSLGIRYDIDWQNLTLIAEWKDSYTISDNEHLLMPYFNSALAGAFTMAINDYRHQPGGFILYSLDDDSWLSALQWKYNIREYFSLEGTAAYLQGESESFFGQYDQDIYLAMNLIWQY